MGSQTLSDDEVEEALWPQGNLEKVIFSDSEESYQWKTIERQIPFFYSLE